MAQGTRNNAPGGRASGGKGGRGSCGGKRQFDGKGPRQAPKSPKK